MTETSSDSTEQLTARLHAYRDAFDRAFALPADTQRDPGIDILMIRMGETVFALRLDELSNVQTCGKVVPIPGSSTFLLGLAGIRGAVVPAFCLATLLGCASTDSKRWVVLCNREAPVGLVFDELLGLRQVQLADIYPAQTAAGQTHSSEVVRQGSQVVSIINLDSVMDQIHRPMKLS